MTYQEYKNKTFDKPIELSPEEVVTTATLQVTSDTWALKPAEYEKLCNDNSSLLNVINVFSSAILGFALSYLASTLLTSRDGGLSWQPLITMAVVIISIGISLALCFLHQVVPSKRNRMMKRLKSYFESNTDEITPKQKDHES